MIARRIFSERRTASPANGAKSRGPVTVHGKANSSRNSLRHGLRASALILDPASESELTELIDSYTSELKPRSTAEHRAVKSLATSDWQQTWIARLETAVLNREINRLRSLEPKADPATLAALAFRSLSDTSCVLDLIHLLESRFARQYERAFDRLQELQALSELEAERAEKQNINERTPELIENKPPFFGPPKKRIRRNRSNQA